MDNPFKETSRSHRLFSVLADADRPLRPDEIASAVGKTDPGVAHSLLKEVRARGIAVHRYRDPNGERPGASVYSLRPAKGFTELTATARPPGRPVTSGPPTPVRPDVRQPQVGSVARVTALLLNAEALQARFECDGVAYVGTIAAAQPSVGEWLTLVTVGLHGKSLYVDLAGRRVVTVENIREATNGD